MYRLLISLYELGQFLRILLWIFVPLAIVSMLVTTWFHYRRKRRRPEEWLFSFQGVESPETASLPRMLLSVAGEISGKSPEPLDRGGALPATLDPEETENIYKGILWMKEKYEQYRELADQRYEELKEELARTEKKYQDLLEDRGRDAKPDPEVPKAQPSESDKAYYPDLLEEKNQQIAFLQQQLDHRIKNYHQSELQSKESKTRMIELEEMQHRTRHLLEEKQTYIDLLEGQLVAERRKIEELVQKLQASSQQLLNIYQELDKSLKPDNGHGPVELRPQ